MRYPSRFGSLTSRPAFPESCPLPLLSWVLSDPLSNSLTSSLILFDSDLDCYSPEKLQFFPPLPACCQVHRSFQAAHWEHREAPPHLSLPSVPHLLVVACSQEVTCLLYISGRASAVWVSPKRGDPLSVPGCAQCSCTPSPPGMCFLWSLKFADFYPCRGLRGRDWPS